jgi:hypothetical protein
MCCRVPGGLDMRPSNRLAASAAVGALVATLGVALAAHAATAGCSVT